MAKRFWIITRRSVLRLGIFFLLLLLGLASAWWLMLYSPGRSFAGEVQVKPTDLSAELERHVRYLAEEVGTRGTHKPEAYAKAADYIVEQFKQAGYETKRLPYEAKGARCENLEAQLPGGAKTSEILVIGAHYDTVDGTPGANDNASGVAGMLSLARMLKEAKPQRTIRFVAFANEEPWYFQTPAMGSYVYAKACKERGDNIVGMISLETIGYYTDEPDSQRYPSPFDKLYSSTGNFVGFVGNVASRSLVNDAIGSFRKHCRFPSESGAIPESVTGIGWSDQWSFWQFGYSAIMVTDTAPFRYRWYHTPSDTPEKLDYPKMATVMEGMAEVVRDLAGR